MQGPSPPLTSNSVVRVLEMVVLVLMVLRLVRMLVVLMVLNGYDAADGADAGVDADGDGDDVVASVLSVEVGPGSSSQPPAPRLKIYLQIPWPYS